MFPLLENFIQYNEDRNFVPVNCLRLWAGQYHFSARGDPRGELLSMEVIRFETFSILFISDHPV